MLLSVSSKPSKLLVSNAIVGAIELVVLSPVIELVKLAPTSCWMKSWLPSRRSVVTNPATPAAASRWPILVLTEPN